MTNLIDLFQCHKESKVKLVRYNENEDSKINIVGKYDGSMFEGSDKLAMNVSSSVDEYLEQTSQNNYNVFEGDRFSNGKFITKVEPLVLKILGDGEEGLKMRGSNQTERQLKSIKTRISNIEADIEFNNSEECLEFIDNYISDATK